MKFIKLLSLLLSFVSCYSQYYNPTLNEGMYQSYIVEMDGVSANQIYDSALKWIKFNDSFSEKVIKSTVKNESIRFEGITGVRKHRVNYVIFIEFKDGQYNVTPEKLEFFPYEEPFERKWFFNKDGTRRANKNSNVLDNALLTFNSMDLGILENVEKNQITKTKKIESDIVNSTFFGTKP